jgi:Na+/melibiose symporter-like transporter
MGFTGLRNLRSSIGSRLESWIGISVIHFVLFLIVFVVTLAGALQSSRCDITVSFAVGACVLSFVGVIVSILSYFTVMNRRPKAEDMQQMV